jgi:hypothetical protein
VSAPTVVPPFDTYYPTPEQMSAPQKAFYAHLVASWRRGQAVDVAGNISYLFCLAYSMIAEADLRQGASELIALSEAYRAESKVSEYLTQWAADCFVVLSDYPSALAVFPPIALDSRASFQTDQLLTIKSNVGAPLSGRDVLTLFGAKVTAFARRRLDTISRYIDCHLAEIAVREGELLSSWVRDPSLRRFPYGAFSGVPLARLPEQPQGYGFSYSSAIDEQCAELTRRAENALREDEGIPRVGEGWVAETKLYYDLKAAFPDIQVHQHARTEWLGYQHLDVFMPSLMMAFEYQGPQHDGPVAFFGGEEAFKEVQRRDARKRRLCSKRGVQLIEVRPGYNLEHLLERVRLRRDSCCN